MRNKKVVITGITGFIGNALAQRLINNGIEVVGVAKEKPEKPITDVHYEVLDLTADVDCFTIKENKPEVIFHCAGSADVRKSIERPVFDFDQNVKACYNVLEAIRKYSPATRFVFLSSAAVYGSPESLPIKEDQHVNPMSPYGLHKMICENICNYYRNVHGIHTDVARIFSAYGEGQSKQLLWDFLKKAKLGRIVLYGTGEESRDFIHVDDLVSALLVIAERGQGNVYNVATGHETKIRKMAKLLASSAGISEDEVMFNGEVKLGDPRNWQADITALRNLGFKQTVALEDGVARYCNWAMKYV